MDDLTFLGNLLEALLWLSIAVALLAAAVRSGGELRRLWLILAAAFLAFSLSDVIESQTGAWWTPWWLFVLKGFCLLVFAYGIWEYRRLKKKPNKPEIPPCESSHFKSDG